MSTQAPAHEAAGLLTPADVARFANVSKATVYRLVAEVRYERSTSAGSFASTPQRSTPT
jgi:hypothetical protein